MAGAIASCSGPIAASMDLFEVIIQGKGCHGAGPHMGNDPIMIATQMLSAWQTIISRNIDAEERAVLSACSINAGNSWNVIPDSAVIKGNVRALSEEVRQLIEKRFFTLTENIAEAFGAKVDINYRCCTPSNVNNSEQTQFACDVADSIFGVDRVLRTIPPDMGSEDFAFMSQERPGCYLILGAENMPDEQISLKGKNINDMPLEEFCFKNACMLHQPDYDFNDEIIPIGATLFARLAERHLA